MPGGLAICDKWLVQQDAAYRCHWRNGITYKALQKLNDTENPSYLLDLHFTAEPLRAK